MKNDVIQPLSLILMLGMKLDGMKCLAMFKIFFGLLCSSKHRVHMFAINPRNFAVFSSIRDSVNSIH